MRKVLSFVLVLSLVLGSFGMAFAAPMSDVAGEDFEDAVNVLTELGVVKGYPDGTYKPDNIVTRAEMAVIVVSALGLADYATGTASFSDMAGHWSNPYVAYATSLGVIAGYPDGTFKPDKTVSYDEAATMLVAALGYNADSLVGTWPANFVTKAKTLGILDGIKAGVAGANRGDIAIMTYQTLDQSIGKTDKDGVWNPTIIKAGPPAVYDVMLDRLGAAEYDPGANAYDQSLASTVGAAFVVTGDEDSVISLKELQGALVKAYANSDDEIIAIKEVVSTFYTGELDAAGVVLAGGDEIGDYEIKASAIPAVVATSDLLTRVFANGTEVTAAGSNEVVNAVVADGNDYTLACKISGNYITEIYSIASWTVDDAFVFEDGDLEDDNIKGNDFATNNNDVIDMDSFALFGVSSLEDIEEGNVVYVYDDGTLVTRVEVGTEVVTGEVTKINSTNTKITVDGKVYEKSSAPGNDAIDWLAVGLEDEVEFSLDYYGDVYAVEILDSQADNFAILLETGSGDPAINGKDGVAKLLLADGTDKIFTVDDDLVVAGVIAADGVWNVGTYNGKNAAGTIIEYGLDEDGNIDALTVFPTATVLTGAVTATDTEITAKGYFDGKAVASDVLVFTYDGARADAVADKADEDNYGITSLDKIKGNEYADVDYLYDDDIKKIVAMVIIGAGSSDDEVYGLVTGWFNTTASGTDMMVTVLVDGVEEEYELTTAGKADITAAGFNDDMLQMLEFTGSGQVDGFVEVDADGAGEATEADLIGPAALTVAYENGVLKTATEYTVASDAIAYKWDTVELEFTKKTVSKSNLAIGVTVYLYDLDEDGVIDIILYR